MIGLVAVPAIVSVTLEDVAREYVSALMARDSHRARAVAERALRAGADPGAVALEVLVPAMRLFGERWADGEISIAHEHYATGVTEGVLAVVAAHMRRPPRGGRLAVLACPVGERHGLGVRLLGDFLEAAGWEALVVGPDTPTRDLLDLVDDEQPDVVALSVTMPAAAEVALELLGALGTAEPRPLIAVGGMAFADGAARAALDAGADLVAPGPRELVTMLCERLPPLPEE